jgi:hypothetical protein
VPKVTDAARVMTLLDETVAAADDLATLTASKLASLTHPESPCTGDSKPAIAQAAPLFAEYRNRIYQVLEAIKRARINVERVEV